jgi:hypothetical protein
VCLLSSSAHLPQEEFPQYGLLWFLFAEFIPRGISAVALMHLMRNTNDAKKREKLTTGRYALSSSLTSAKKGDFSFHQVSSSLFHLSIHFFNRSRVPPPPPMTTTATPWVTVWWIIGSAPTLKFTVSDKSTALSDIDRVPNQPAECM